MFLQVLFALTLAVDTAYFPRGGSAIIGGGGGRGDGGRRGDGQGPSSTAAYSALSFDATALSDPATAPLLSASRDWATAFVSCVCTGCGVPVAAIVVGDEAGDDDRDIDAGVGNSEPLNKVGIPCDVLQRLGVLQVLSVGAGDEIVVVLDHAQTWVTEAAAATTTTNSNNNNAATAANAAAAPAGNDSSNSSSDGGVGSGRGGGVDDRKARVRFGAQLGIATSAAELLAATPSSAASITRWEGPMRAKQRLLTLRFNDGGHGGGGGGGGAVATEFWAAVASQPALSPTTPLRSALARLTSDCPLLLDEHPTTTTAGGDAWLSTHDLWRWPSSSNNVGDGGGDDDDNNMSVVQRWTNADGRVSAAVFELRGPRAGAAAGAAARPGEGGGGGGDGGSPVAKDTATATSDIDDDATASATTFVLDFHVAALRGGIPEPRTYVSLYGWMHVVVVVVVVAIDHRSSGDERCL